MDIPTIPAWCKGLPDSTILFSCDILEFFKFNGDLSSSSVSSCIKCGLLPKPSPIITKSVAGVFSGAHRNRKSLRNKQWILGDIRRLRKDMLNDKAQYDMMINQINEAK